MKDTYSFIKANLLKEDTFQILGTKIENVSLIQKDKSFFYAKIPTLDSQGKKVIQNENLVFLKNKQVVVLAEKEDKELRDTIKKFYKYYSTPEKFFLTVIEEQSDEILDMITASETQIDILESAIVTGKIKHTMAKMIFLKRNLMKIRSINRSYMRIASYCLRENPRLNKDFLGVYEKLLHFDELAESYRELISSLLDAYLSVISNRMNQVMKFLTIIMTTAIPVTVISGIYGMNIPLPLQAQEYAFEIILILMLITGIVMFILFTKFGWLKEPQ
ncbi:MAG: CorA family divalent cation transporter [archaeon]|jgi:magnesium transporter